MGEILGQLVVDLIGEILGRLIPEGGLLASFIMREYMIPCRNTFGRPERTLFAQFSSVVIVTMHIIILSRVDLSVCGRSAARATTMLYGIANLHALTFFCRQTHFKLGSFHGFCLSRIPHFQKALQDCLWD
jgi:hypothetical protein